MKRIISIFLVLTSIVLTGCTKTPTNNSSNLQSTTKITQNESLPLNTEEEMTNSNNQDSTTTENTTGQLLPEYDDGGDWHGTID